MNLDRRRQVEHLYQAAQKLDMDQQRAFLAEACAGDLELLQDVESMLSRNHAASTVAPLNAPDWLESTPAVGSAPGHRRPGNIGRYRILRLLGEGGMGLVYEAEQEQPRRVVALKVIKPGFTSEEQLRRFELESRALGRLQHPGIAQIYEAGMADAGFGPQHFFAMEFIRGCSLREYASAEKLDVRQRLELMIKICDAVHHAHQRGLIHRDLKPSNILVDETGQPKILDFGVARLTDSDARATRQTDLGQLVGTLAYMSPEQVLGDPLGLDTRSDVYSLGVILYEFLAARLPYQISSNLQEALQTICEEDPARLSSVNRSYRGDVETIVAKALEKDKTRRYSSAAELAEDLRRYLQDQPIVARPASTAYQLQKFARRHKPLVAGVTTVFVVLAGGIVASTWQATRATRAQQAALRERDRAAAAEKNATEERDLALSAEQAATAAKAQALQERNRAVQERQRADIQSATAKAVNDFLRSDLLGQASPVAQARPENRPDPDLKVRTALDRAAARLEGRFTTQPLVEASIRQTIGEAYVDLGLWEEAERQIERAVALRQRVLGPTHPETLQSMYWLAGDYRNHGRYAQAEALVTKVLDTQRRLLGENHEDTLSSMNLLARAYMGQGKYEQARTLLSKTVEGQRRLLGKEHLDTLNSLNELAVVCRLERKYAEAEPLFTEVLDVKRRVLGNEHPSTLTTMNDLAIVYAVESKYPEAEQLLDKVLEVRLRVEGEGHPDTLTNMANLGEIYRIEGKYAEAEPLLARALEGRRRVLGEHPLTLTSVTFLAHLYADEGKYGQAEALYAEALKGRSHLSGPNHPDTLMTMYNLADLYRKEGKDSEAETLITQMLNSRSNSQDTFAPVRMKSLVFLGELRLRQQRYPEAETLLREALNSHEQKSPNVWERYNIQSLLGGVVAAQGRYAEAEPILLSGYEGLIQVRSTIPRSSRSSLQEAGERIIQFYLDWKKPGKATEWRNRMQASAAVEGPKP